MTSCPPQPSRPFTVMFVVMALIAGPASAQPQPCLTASKFGPNDQVGNLNHVTPAKTLAATKLVTTGKAYRLGIETNRDTPAYPPRTLRLVGPPDIPGASMRHRSLA